MRPQHHFPSRDRLSVLTAVIVLAYALMRFLDFPALAVATTFFGSDLGFEIGGALLMLVLVAALISAGSDTLIRSHPVFARQLAGSTVLYWILPGATALVLGVALDRAPDGLAWWLALGASAVALIVVFIGEYIVVDPEDPARDAAALALTALAYALALIFFVLLHSSGLRAAISGPVGGLVAAALAWRLMALRAVPPARAWIYAAAVGLMCAESIWALNYWRVASSGAGLLVIIVFYIGVGVAQQHLSGGLRRRVWIEFIVVGLVGLAIALSSAWTQGP